MREPQSESQTESVEITEVESCLVSLVHDVAQKQSRVLVEEEGSRWPLLSPSRTTGS